MGSCGALWLCGGYRVTGSWGQQSLPLDPHKVGYRETGLGCQEPKTTEGWWLSFWEVLLGADLGARASVTDGQHSPPSESGAGHFRGDLASRCLADAEGFRGS